MLEAGLNLGRALWRRSFLRFLCVGAVNTLFGYGAYAVLVMAGQTYERALLYATILGVIFNFQTIGGLVFRNRDKGLIFRFFGVYLVTYLVNRSLLDSLVELTGSPLLAQAMAILVVVPVSYVLNRLFVFGMSNSKN